MILVLVSVKEYNNMYKINRLSSLINKVLIWYVKYILFHYYDMPYTCKYGTKFIFFFFFFFIKVYISSWIYYTVIIHICVIFKHPWLVYSHAGKKLCGGWEGEGIQLYIFKHFAYINHQFTLPIVNIIPGEYCTMHIRNMAVISLKQSII